jgi:hypothetical protein
MFKKLSYSLLLTTTLSAEPITPENRDCFALPKLNCICMTESDITQSRGGISREQDLVTSKEIAKSCLRDQYPQGVLPEKLEKESLEFANNMLKDASTYLGFKMVGKNIAARKMYMALCARVLIEKRGELLSENACVTFAKMALQAHKN